MNWIRLKSRLSAFGQRADQQRLAQTRHALEQRVTADEQAGEDAVDNLVVADDDLGNLGLHLVVPRPEFKGAGFHRL